MEPGGGPESAGDAGAHGNKREESQLPPTASPVSSDTSIPGGDAPNTRYFKGLIVEVGV